MTTSIILVLGWIGAVLLAGCGIPQAIKAYRTKHVDDLSALFLWMWVLGEVLVLLYIVWNDYTQWPLIFNYGVNIIVIVFLLLAKLIYRA